MSKKTQNSGRRALANVTSVDVARRAGVSQMTVSRVINGKRNVSDDTREIVLNAIEELGYEPNRAARTLASANPIKIGLLYFDPNSTYLSAMLIGVLQQARVSDTQIVIESTDDLHVSKVIRSLMADGIDGFILAPPLCDSLNAFRTIQENDLLAVTIGSPRIAENISSVCIDDQQAMQTLTRYLINLGHRRIGFIIGSSNQSASQLRLAGYRAALKKAGIDSLDELVVQGEFSYQSGFNAADQLLQLDEIPTAIIASNDDMAAGAIATAHRHNMDVPEELTICGFDDTLLSTTLWPQITTIHQPIGRMSFEAIKHLEDNIRRRRAEAEPEYEHFELDFELKKRQSDAPPLAR